MGCLSLTRRVKQQLEVCLLTSVRSSVVATWTSLSVLRNNVKRNNWGSETICTKVLYSNGKKADPGLIYVLHNKDCPWHMYVLLWALPIHVTCIIYGDTNPLIPSCILHKKSLGGGVVMFIIQCILWIKCPSVPYVDMRWPHHRWQGHDSWSFFLN